MLDNNHKQNPDCAFSEQLISYIYGETSRKENSLFSAHLQNCQSCSQEIAGFSVVRSTISDWRQEEFSKLVTPVIEIPYRTENTRVVLSSRFDSIRAFFAFPGAAVGAAFALIAVCAGLFYLTYNFSNDNDLALVDNSNAVSKSAIKADKVENIEILSEAEKEIPEKNVAAIENNQTSPPASKPPLIQKIVPSVNPRNNGEKPYNEKAISARNLRNVSNDNRSLSAATGVQAPRLTNLEEEEDSSIRLLDLFDEIGSE